MILRKSNLKYFLGELEEILDDPNLPTLRARLEAAMRKCRYTKGFVSYMFYCIFDIIHGQTN